MLNLSPGRLSPLPSSFRSITEEVPMTLTSLPPPSPMKKIGVSKEGSIWTDLPGGGGGGWGVGDGRPEKRDSLPPLQNWSESFRLRSRRPGHPDLGELRTPLLTSEVGSLLRGICQPRRRRSRYTRRG